MIQSLTTLRLISRTSHTTHANKAFLTRLTTTKSTPPQNSTQHPPLLSLSSSQTRLRKTPIHSHSFFLPHLPQQAQHRMSSTVQHSKTQTQTRNPVTEKPLILGIHISLTHLPSQEDRTRIPHAEHVVSDPTPIKPSRSHQQKYLICDETTHMSIEKKRRVNTWVPMSRGRQNTRYRT